MLRHKRLRDVLRYDPETGLFFWLVNRPRGVKAGDEAGSFTYEGYRRVRIDNREYFAHRVAWFYVHKRWPPHEIDHINGEKADNRLVNLRLATRSQNRANSKTDFDSTSGLKGANYNKAAKKWQVQFEKKFLGFFSTPEAAHELYCRLAREKYGEFARG